MVDNSVEKSGRQPPTMTDYLAFYIFAEKLGKR
jgi:hypothetical protein